MRYDDAVIWEPKRGPLPTYPYLVGGWRDDFQGTGAALADEARAVLTEALRTRGLQPQFGTDLPGSNGNLVETARRSESFHHWDGVSGMVGQLWRLGWIVYPGDVGVVGTFALADLAAVRGNEILFVECLTKKTIKLGKHEHKAALAARVPMCFVGAVPKDFVDSLPEDSYAIEDARSAKLITGEWVPHFFRTTRGARVRFQGRWSTARRYRYLTIVAAGLQLALDVGSFIAAGIAYAWCGGVSRDLRARGIEVTLMRGPLGAVPYEYPGKAGSTIRLKTATSSVSITLGQTPLRARVEGGDQAIDVLRDLLRGVGLPIEIV